MTHDKAQLGDGEREIVEITFNITLKAGTVSLHFSQEMI